MNDECRPAMIRPPAAGVEGLAGAVWRRRGIAAALVLLLLPLVVFAPAALLRGAFYFHDVQHYFYPYHKLAADLVAQGYAPLWNPYAFSGIPLIGDGQAALFYPPSWLFFVLPGAAALNYDVLLQFCIAGAGMYLFVRALGLWRLPAFVAAVAYMFGGFMTTRVVHLSILSGAALLPLLFFCVERALGSGSRRWFAVAAVVVALQAVAGHPQVPIYTALALGLYVLVHVVERAVVSGDWRQACLPPLQLAAIYLLGYGLAAVQLAPWIEVGSLSPRAAGASFDFVFGGSTSGGEWLLFLFPYLYGSLQPGIYAAEPMGIATAVKTWEHSAYVGILPLGLAAVGLLELGAWRGLVPPAMPLGGAERAARCRRWFSVCSFALLLLLGLLIAAGRHTPFAGLIYAAPLIGKLRDVERALVLAAFALAALAAFGMQRLIEPGRGPRERAPRPGVLLVAVAVVLVPLGVALLSQQPAVQAALDLQPHDVENLQLHRPNAYVPLLLALASAALLAWWSGGPVGERAQVLAAALVVLDMAAYAAPFNPTTDPQLYARQPEVVDFLRRDAAPFRKATFLTNNALESRAAQETLAVSWSMVYGIPDINGFNSLQPRRYTDYLFGPGVDDVSYGYLTDDRLLQPDSPILSALNVKYLLVPAGERPNVGAGFRQVYANADVRVYENTQVYPWAYFVETVRGETNRDAVLHAVTAPGFDGRRLALVEPAPPPALPPPAAGARLDEVTLARSTPNEIALATSTAGPRFLVLSEIYFPGWHAYVDGAETPIYRANYLFRGVVVPPGRHAVTFAYRPTSLAIGAAVSALALALIGGLWLTGRRRQRVALERRT